MLAATPKVAVTSFFISAVPRESFFYFSFV
jgi:hypothetical protein